MTSEPWYPGNYRPAPQYPPHYRTMPDFLRVVDTIYPTLNGKQFEFWCAARNHGLDEWRDATGFDLRVKGPRGANKPNRVTLAWMTAQEEADFLTPAIHQFNEDGSDWVHISRTRFVQMFLSRTPRPVAYWVAHELGHSLGFGHGGNGIMDQTPSHAYVNVEEALAAVNYWTVLSA